MPLAKAIAVYEVQARLLGAAEGCQDLLLLCEGQAGGHFYICQDLRQCACCLLSPHSRIALGALSCAYSALSCAPVQPALVGQACLLLQLHTPPAQTFRQQLMLLCIMGSSHAQWPALGAIIWLLAWLLRKQSSTACPAEPTLHMELAVTCPSAGGDSHSNALPVAQVDMHSHCCHRHQPPCAVSPTQPALNGLPA